MTEPVFHEPYFLPANHPNFLANGESWVENNQQFRQSQKYWFFRCALDYLTHSDLQGSYFEFGVHRARTFTMAMSLDVFYAHNMGVTNRGLKPLEGGGFFREYVAFDSFEGFPPDAKDVANVAANLKTSRDEFLNLVKKMGQSTQRIKIVSGFYSESLTEELASDFRKRDTKVSLVCVDCNLYESHRDVLSWCDEFLQPGAIVYLDDFNSFPMQNDRGPRKAWRQYTKDSCWAFDEFLNVGWWGKSFVVQRRL